MKARWHIEVRYILFIFSIGVEGRLVLLEPIIGENGFIDAVVICFLLTATMRSLFAP